MVEAGIEGTGKGLAAGDKCPPSPPAVPVVIVTVFVLGVVFDVCLHNLLHVANFNEHVLGLQIRVDDAALAMEVIEAEQNLLGDLLYERHGYAAVVPPLDQTQQVLTQNFKHHADVDAIGAFVIERVEQTDNVLAAGMVLVGIDNFFQQLDLVESRLGVVSSGADDLKGNVLARIIVARQPDGGEMTPAQLAHNGVLAVLVLLADLDRVVAAFAVVLRILLIGCILGLVDG